MGRRVSGLIPIHKSTLAINYCSSFARGGVAVLLRLSSTSTVNTKNVAIERVAGILRPRRPYNIVATMIKSAIAKVRFSFILILMFTYSITRRKFMPLIIRNTIVDKSGG